MNLIVQRKDTMYCWLVAIANYIAVRSFQIDSFTAIRMFFSSLSPQERVQYRNCVKNGLPAGLIEEYVAKINALFKINLRSASELNYQNMTLNDWKNLAGVSFGRSIVSMSNHVKMFAGGLVYEQYDPPCIYYFVNESQTINSQNFSNSQLKRNTEDMKFMAQSGLLEIFNDVIETNKESYWKDMTEHVYYDKTINNCKRLRTSFADFDLKYIKNRRRASILTDYELNLITGGGNIDDII